MNGTRRPSSAMPRPSSPPEAEEPSYSLGAVGRLTGLSAHVLRAWERRYQAVVPLRTEGGTRRYRESDVARLRLLSAAVSAGHPIGDVAGLPDDELRRRVEQLEDEPKLPLLPILDALERLDSDEAERLLGLQLAALGPRRFATSVVEPLLHDVGRRWESGTLCVAAEHLVSALVRSLLGGALRRRPGAEQLRPLLLSTLPGDRHEIGVLICAVVAAELGANPIYLGPDLPPEEIVTAVDRSRAAVVTLGVSSFAPKREREAKLTAAREALPGTVALWVGGAGVAGLRLPAGIDVLADLVAFEQKLALLTLRPDRANA